MFYLKREDQKKIPELSPKKYIKMNWDNNGGQSILANGVYIHISPTAWLHEKQGEYLENCICLHYQIVVTIMLW